MKREKWTEYDKYICLADDTRVISGTYTGYVQFRELMNLLGAWFRKIKIHILIMEKCMLVN